MQTGLVFLGIEIRAPKLQNGPVVPPKEEANSPLDDIRHHNVRPKLPSKDILRCELHQCRYLLPLLVQRRTPHNIDRYQNATTNSRQHDEDVPEHSKEP